MIRPRSRGFTLIELLVVIAIIAILAAILFPVFVRVKESGKQGACLSNQKQLYTGLMMYANDRSDVLPVSYAIYSGSTEINQTYACFIRPYLRNWQVMSCPTRPTTDVERWDGRCGYLMTTDIANWTVAGAPRRATPLSEFVDQRMILLLDGPVYPPGDAYSPMPQSTWGSTDVAMAPSNFASTLNYTGVFRKRYYPYMVRHSDGLNCTSVDGHSKWVRSGLFTAPMFTKQRD